MLGRDEKMQPGSIDFSNFTQGFSFVNRDDIFETREFSKPH